MKKDKSMPPPARPLSKEQLTSKVKEFPVNYGSTIVGITTVDSLAGGPPSTDLTYVLEGARSAVTFAVPLDEDKTRDYLGKIDREGHQRDYTRASVNADGIAAQLASFLRQFGHPTVAVMQNLVFRNDKPGDLDHRTPDISHKYLAVRSGVGWFGFSGNVLTPDHGPNVILVSVVTAAELIPTDPLPPEENYCDDCQACNASCPSGFFCSGKTDKVTVTIGGVDFTDTNYRSYSRCSYVCSGHTGLHPSGNWSTWSPARDYGAPLPEKWPVSKLYDPWETFKKPPSHLEYGALSNAAEDSMADTIRADWACNFLHRKHDKPFFLAVGLYAPHRPNYVPQKYFDLYPLDSVELPVWKEGDLDDLPESIRGPKLKRKKVIHDRLVELQDAKPTLRGYLAALSYADAMLGRVLDALDESGHADNTIVVLWSDNGYHHGEKTHWGKHTMWERTTNVPFMWAGPGVASGAKIDATVGLIDTYPTLLEFCGLPPNDQVEGVSLASVLRKPKNATDRSVVVSGAEEPHFAVINQSWRYIRYRNGEEELYDLNEDPHEWNNLATDENAYADVRQTMAAHLPENPAKPGLGLKSRTTRLVLEGEDFRWVAVDAISGQKGKPKRAASVNVETGTDRRTVRHDKVLKPGKPFTIQIQYHGLKQGLVAGMSLNWHKPDGKFGGKLFVFEKITGVENDKVYTRTVEIDKLPEGIGWARLMTTVSPNGVFADRTHHRVGEEIPVEK